MLKDKEKITYYSNINQKQKIMEIIKKYDQTTMENNESCLGYTISVFQESINKSFDEFLVNFDYLNTLMNDYGFQLIDKHEQNKYGFLEACGSFELLFQQMRNMLRRDPEKSFGEAIQMTENEKRISFLNNYFVYKKIRDVDYRHIPFEEVKEQEQQEIVKEQEQEINHSNSKIIRKFKEKIILENAEFEKEDVREEPELEEPEEKEIPKQENVVLPIPEPIKKPRAKKVEKEKKEKKIFIGDVEEQEEQIQEPIKKPRAKKVEKEKKEKKIFIGDVEEQEEQIQEPIKKPRATRATRATRAKKVVEKEIIGESVVEPMQQPEKKTRKKREKKIFVGDIEEEPHKGGKKKKTQKRKK